MTTAMSLMAETTNITEAVEEVLGTAIFGTEGVWFLS